MIVDHLVLVWTTFLGLDHILYLTFAEVKTPDNQLTMCPSGSHEAIRRFEVFGEVTYETEVEKKTDTKWIIIVKLVV